jgi:hypothetical protein
LAASVDPTEARNSNTGFQDRPENLTGPFNPKAS